MRVLRDEGFLGVWFFWGWGFLGDGGFLGMRGFWG